MANRIPDTRITWNLSVLGAVVTDSLSGEDGRTERDIGKKEKSLEILYISRYRSYVVLNEWY